MHRLTVFLLILFRALRDEIELQELITSLTISIYIKIETDIAVLQRFLSDLYRLFDFLLPYIDAFNFCYFCDSGKPSNKIVTQI